MYAVNLAADGRILSATYSRFASADAILVETLPEGNITDYLYAGGEFIHAPLPQPEKPATVSIWEELDEAYQEGVDAV